MAGCVRIGRDLPFVVALLAVVIVGLRRDMMSDLLVLIEERSLIKMASPRLFLVWRDTLAFFRSISACERDFPAI